MPWFFYALQILLAILGRVPGFYSQIAAMMSFGVIPRGKTDPFHHQNHQCITNDCHDRGGSSGCKPEWTDFLRVSRKYGDISKTAQITFWIPGDDNDLQIVTQVFSKFT